MSKNTTDLREQLRVIIEDTDYRDYGEPDCEEQIRLLEQLISNREKLARIDELERLFDANNGVMGSHYIYLTDDAAYEIAKALRNRIAELSRLSREESHE